MATERRKPGRPRSDESKTTVSTWIGSHEHDRLIKLANRREQSVSETVRQILKHRLDTQT